VRALPIDPPATWTLRLAKLVTLFGACVALAVITAGCSSPQTSTSHRATGPGCCSAPIHVPLHALAERALGASEGYAVNDPQDVRAVVTTEATLCRLMSEAGSSCTQSRVYLISLRGPFSCPGCGTGVAANATTTSTSPPRITTMYVAVPASDTKSTGGVAVGVAGPNLSTVGHVYDLDPYVKALAGKSVPVGPLPG
jgi:hypothetical protein